MMQTAKHHSNVNGQLTALARPHLRRQGVWPLMLGVLLSTSQSGGAATPRTETVRVPITAARAEIELGTNVGRLELGPSISGQLLDGTLGLGRHDWLERTLSQRGHTQMVRLAARQTRPDFGLSGSLNNRGVL